MLFTYHSIASDSHSNAPAMHRWFDIMSNAPGTANRTLPVLSVMMTQAALEDRPDRSTDRPTLEGTYEVSTCRALSLPNPKPSEQAAYAGGIRISRRIAATPVGDASPLVTASSNTCSSRANSASIRKRSRWRSPSSVARIRRLEPRTLALTLRERHTTLPGSKPMPPELLSMPNSWSGRSWSAQKVTFS